MMTKEGFTKIAKCMTLRVGVVVLWCGHSGDTAKEPQCRVPDTQVICCPAREIYFSHGDVIFAIEDHLPPLCSGTPAVKHDLGFSGIERGIEKPSNPGPHDKDLIQPPTGMDIVKQLIDSNKLYSPLYISLIKNMMTYSLLKTMYSRFFLR